MTFSWESDEPMLTTVLHVRFGIVGRFLVKFFVKKIEAKHEDTIWVFR